MLHDSASPLVCSCPKKGEKALANPSKRVKRIKTINTNQSVPKKTKIVQTKNEAPTEAATPRPRRAPTNRKRSAVGAKKVPTAQGADVSMPLETEAPAEPSEEQVRLRAYFISERRRRFALPGSAESDWLEAKRQLLSEADRR
jgi:Protein of unknown function (DUF2934)